MILGARLGVATGLLSRPLLFITNAAMVPLLITSSSDSVFASYLVIASIGDWATNVRGGAAEAQLSDASRAHAENRFEEAKQRLAIGQRAVEVAALVVLASGLIASAGFAALRPEWSPSVLVATAMISATMFLSVAPLTRAHRNQTSVNHVIRLGSGCAALLLAAAAVYFDVELSLLAVTMLGLTAPLLSHTVVWMTNFRDSAMTLFALRRVDVSKPQVKQAFADGLPFLAFSLAQSATATAATIVLAPFLDPPELIGFVLALRLSLFVTNSLWSALRPMWPALAAKSQGTQVSLVPLAKMAGVACLAAAVAGVGSVAVGPQLVRWWSASASTVDRSVLVPLAVLSVAKTWVHSLYIFRASGSVPRSDAWLWLAEAVAVVACLTIGAFLGDAQGAAWGLVVAVLATSGVTLSVRTLRMPRRTKLLAPDRGTL